MKTTAQASPQQNLRHLASLLGVSPYAVAASVAHETVARSAHLSGAKMGIAVVNGEPRLLPCDADGKIRLSVAEICAIWHLPLGARIEIGR